ncbi:hypothetical protein ACFS6H_13315 [Terrimonas rubra]|uniref:DUF4625 domain-containing protein n=1 Tax=Terrimonas rubra TaxID=1035890 RepID=A0ABW6A7G6_9BACT
MKNKLYLLLLLFHMAGMAVYAQVQIQGTLPAVGLVQRNQLWNLVLINGAVGDINGVVELKLRDRSNGLELLTAVTNTITLKKGANTVNINNLSPVQYNYTGMQPDNSLNGLIPVGSYIACYSFVHFVSDYQETLAQECFSFDVEALSPPMLIYPTDSSRLDIAPAQFSWIPPAPANLFQALRYEYLVVEINPGQLAAEAIQENIPLYNTGSLSNNVLSYSAASPAFQKDKWYAWQVIARDGDQYAGKSETWVFSVTKADSIPVKRVESSYMVLTDNVQNIGINTLTDKWLRLNYYSYSGSYKTEIVVVAPSGDVIQREEMVVKYGDNYFDIKLKTDIKKGEVYIIILNGIDNKKYKALFSLTNQK